MPYHYYDFLKWKFVSFASWWTNILLFRALCHREAWTGGSNTNHIVLYKYTYCDHSHVQHTKGGRVWIFQSWIKSVHIGNEEWACTIYSENKWSILGGKFSQVITHQQVNVWDCVIPFQAWACLLMAFLNMKYFRMVRAKFYVSSQVSHLD